MSLADAHESSRRMLWLAVVELALLDAQHARAMNGTSRSNRQMATDEARRWLLHGGGDFAEVCTLAEVDPSAVREAALRRIAQAEAGA